MSAAEKRAGRARGTSATGVRRFRGPGKQVDRITDAKKSQLEDWHHRRRLYLGLQIARIPVLVLAVILLWVTNNLILGAVVAFISVPLPWVAVMLANESGEATKESEKVYKPGLVRANRAALANSQLSQATSPQRQLDPSDVDSTDRHPVIDHEAED